MRRLPTKPGQESVWDYPRPPRLEPEPGRIRIVFNGEVIADTARAYRVLETSHPPVYYIPPQDVRRELLGPSRRRSFCEWKGRASFVTLRLGSRAVEDAGWFYPEPTPAFERIRGYLAFYAGPMDSCRVGDEEAMPQPGGFYGGWITSNIVGPFKGDPGTEGW
ncbi:MAG: DUF427 domain-containing protein [Acidobacteria bacterium]|nr:DUF427 domain-containing protein [Acidobacteriota bacterium]NIM61773.1 DUF427 domain-containing protein [Acidobacteriota bacterium]NIO60017.1 DUF427 domain-containing protein [Acidobacteriota bacterium]NIQ29209.1 DUF427 domain-containing protein [Acidobacteriota bacterium]NIQ83783.1 DUF427 domain-containing protein [Acidobacteriota bacterium]